MIMLDSEHDWQVGSHQHTWLEADLSAVNRSITPWVIVTRLEKLLSKLVRRLEGINHHIFLVQTFFKRAFLHFFKPFRMFYGVFRKFVVIQLIFVLKKFKNLSLKKTLFNAAQLYAGRVQVIVEFVYILLSYKI